MEQAHGKIRPLKTHHLMRELLAARRQAAAQARESGQKVVWCTGQAPTDLVVAMGFVPVYPENHAATCGAAGVSTQLCEVAEDHQYSGTLCSYVRTNLGLALGGRMPAGPVAGLPRPDLLLTSTICHTYIKWFQELSRFYEVPLLVLDVPYTHDGLNGEERQEGIRYVVRQLKEWIRFLEEYTGQQYDHDKFRECVASTARAAQFYARVVESMRHVPSPITSFDVFLHLGVLVNCRGFPEAVSYYATLLREVEERVQQGISAVGKERYRVYWDSIPVWFRVGAMARRLAAEGACVVAARYPLGFTESFVGQDQARPLESIAEAQCLRLGNSGTETRVSAIQKMIEEYAVDGLIMQMSRTCKVLITDQLGMTREIQKRTGLPTVVLDGDMVDTRLFSDAQTETRLQAFLEQLAAVSENRRGTSRGVGLG